MERFEYTAAPENEGERLDKALAGVCGQLSRSALQELIEAGRVLRNGKPADKKEKLKAGDVLQVEIPDAAPAEAVQIAESFQHAPLGVGIFCILIGNGHFFSVVFIAADGSLHKAGILF